MSRNSEEVKKCQKRKKQMAVERMGGCCSKCGYNKCLSALEFHHVDKDEKSESPSYVIMRWSWERAKKELEKCILVCSNCHKELHDDASGIRLIAPERLRRIWIDKICPQCKTKFETRDEKQIYCGLHCNGLSNRKVARPSEEDLKRLIGDKATWVQMGKMFGVSDNSVRKWARSYNLI